MSNRPLDGPSVCAVAGGRYAFDPCVGSVPGFCCPKAIKEPRAVSRWAGALDEAEPGGLVVNVQHGSAAFCSTEAELHDKGRVRIVLRFVVWRLLR